MNSGSYESSKAGEVFFCCCCCSNVKREVKVQWNRKH